jgi:hypothetical protein
MRLALDGLFPIERPKLTDDKLLVVQRQMRM